MTDFYERGQLELFADNAGSGAVGKGEATDALQSELKQWQAAAVDALHAVERHFCGCNKNCGCETHQNADE